MNDQALINLQKKLQQSLTDGASQLGLSLSEQQVTQLLAYLYEFEKWNKAYNLSAIRNLEHMVVRHLLDSLAVVPHVHTIAANNIIDVGTGGGLPGIPLAIMFPERIFTLLDSNGKKTRFLFHLKNQLQLDNVRVVNARVEEFKPSEKFQIVISRAFASLLDMTKGCAELIAEDGVFMAMKGIYPHAELTALGDEIDLLASFPLQVPDSEGERHLLLLRPCANNTKSLIKP